jgi:hypothetical protein
LNLLLQITIMYIWPVTKASFYKLRQVPKRARLYTVHFIPSKQMPSSYAKEHQFEYSKEFLKTITVILSCSCFNHCNSWLMFQTGKKVFWGRKYGAVCL